MDIWGVGCVFFEILSLFPLFPGTNELDQVNKIHNILGTPSAHILNRFQKNASHMDFNFAVKEGTGIDKLVPQLSQETKDIILQLLVYNPDDRCSARQALKHSYFKELCDNDKIINKVASPLDTVRPEPDNDENIKNSSKKFQQLKSKLPEVKQEELYTMNYEASKNLPPIKSNEKYQMNSHTNIY